MTSYQCRSFLVATVSRLCGAAAIAAITLGAPMAQAQDEAAADDTPPPPTVAAGDYVTHHSGEHLKRVSASHLYEKCMLLGSFAEDLPEDYADVALAGGWSGVLDTFNSEDVQFMTLCLGSQPNRAHVWVENPDQDGTFFASGPQFPPHWTIGDNGTFCLGTIDDMSCAELYAHDDSGLLYLSFIPAEEDLPAEDATGDADDQGGDIWIIFQDEENVPLFEDIHLHLNQAAAE